MWPAARPAPTTRPYQLARCTYSKCNPYPCQGPRIHINNKRTKGTLSSSAPSIPLAARRHHQTERSELYEPGRVEGAGTSASLQHAVLVRIVVLRGERRLSPSRARARDALRAGSSWGQSRGEWAVGRLGGSRTMPLREPPMGLPIRLTPSVASRGLDRSSFLQSLL